MALKISPDAYREKPRTPTNSASIGQHFHQVKTAPSKLLSGIEVLWWYFALYGLLGTP